MVRARLVSNKYTFLNHCFDLTRVRIPRPPKAGAGCSTHSATSPSRERDEYLTFSEINTVCLSIITLALSNIYFEQLFSEIFEVQSNGVKAFQCSDTITFCSKMFYSITSCRGCDENQKECA